MKLRLIIPAALTAMALAGCGSSTSDGAGADVSDPAETSAEATAEASEPAPEATAGADAGEPTEAAATPMPTTGQGEQPGGASVASFAECSEEYLDLTTDLLPGGAVTPEVLEKWQLAYQDSSQYFAEGSASEAAAACNAVLANVKATLGG